MRVDRRVDELTPLAGELHKDAAAVLGVREAPHEPGLLEAIEPVGHARCGDQGLDRQAGGREAVGIAGTPERREHVEPSRLQPECREELVLSLLEAVRDAQESGEHGHAREVEAGTLAPPGGDRLLDVVFCRSSARGRHQGVMASILESKYLDI